MIRLYEANVIFEANIEANGSCFLTIYGEHANGYFCAIPNWGISCELSDSTDTFYNEERLESVGLQHKTAYALAQSIKQIVAHLKQVGVRRDEK